MWLNGLCCGGLCGVGEVLKRQQQPLDDQQDQEELNPSSDCGTQETTAVRPHAVMGCTPSILSSNSGNNQQQKRKESFGQYGGNVSSAGSGALAESNGANSNKFPNSNATLNQAQMLGFGQGGGKDAIGGMAEKVICFSFVDLKLCSMWEGEMMLYGVSVCVGLLTL